MQSKASAIRHCIAVVAMIFCVVFCTIPAFAATTISGTVTVDANGYLEFSYDQSGAAGTSSGSISGNVVAYSAKCSSGYSSTGTTTTLTVKNVYTTAVKITYNTSSTVTLEPNKSATLGSVKSTSKYSEQSASVTINSVEIVAATYTPTFQVPVNGTYTVDGTSYDTAYTPSGDALYDTTQSYALVATADSGYEFFGWFGSVNGYYGSSTTLAYTCGATETVTAVFAPEGCAEYYISGDSMRYCFLDEAITAAQNSTSKMIVVAKSGTVYHSDGKTKNFTIPAGVTLLLPYSDSDLSIKSGTANTNDFKHANVAFAYSDVTTESAMNPQTSVVYTLTIPSKTTIDVADGDSSSYGRIIVGGTIAGKEGSRSTTFEGATYGAHSNLVVDGTLNLGSYSVLSAAGYVLGSGAIKTTGTAAEIYQPMVLHDWRGAKTSALFVSSELNAKLSSQSGEDEISPFTQWGTFNIWPELTMEYGNLMYMYASVYDGDAYCSHPLLVGAGSGLIQLHSGATLTSKYEDITWGSSYTYGYPGRNSLTISGGATLGTIALDTSITLIKTYNVSFDSTSFTLPISYAYAVTLDNGDYYVDKSMALLPGSSITVTNTANLHVGENSALRFMVFDGLNNRVMQQSATSNTVDYVENQCYYNKNYATTANLQAATVNGSYMSGDAELIVDGTLTIGQYANFGGVIQTNGTGTIDAKAGTSGNTTGTSVQIGVLGTKKVLLSDFAIAGVSLHEMNAQIVSAATGERRDIIRGVIYKGSAYETTQKGYSFKYYADSSDTASVMLIGDATAASTETTAATHDAHPLNETIRGAWTCETHTDEDSDHTCDVCGYQIPVAMIDNTRYESLQAALDAVLEGDTIVLLAAPEDGVVFNKCVTIDTNGITYNIKCAEGWEAKNKGDGIYLVGNTSLFDIYASSIRAGDSLDLYFYIDQDNLGGSSKSEFKASITRYYAGGSPETTTVDGSQWTDSDDYYRFSYNGIAAKEMTDKIFVTIYKGDTQVSNVRMETVENYALRVLNKQVKDADANSKDAALRTTLVDMLNYGAACQTYFDGYAADNPANAQIDDFQQYATQSVTYDNTQTGNEGIYGSSVSAESKLVYTFYYTFNPSDRNLTAYVTYEDHYGKNVELTIRSFREKQGYYGVDVEGLAVADGRQTITCQLKDENGEVTHTASGNVESYVAVAVANAGEDKDVFLSLLKFVDSARAYFHSGEET